MLKLLVVEDDPRYLDELRSEVLASLTPRVEVRHASDATSALEAARRFRPDLVLLDMVFPLAPRGAPSVDAGARVLEGLAKEAPGAAVIALSGQDREFAVRLMCQHRILDFLFKDMDWGEIRVRVGQHVAAVQSARDNRHLREEIQAARGVGEVLAADPALKRVLAALDRVAATDSTVMLRGESGTGKEVLARHVHASSPRRDSAFVAVNCGALDESLVLSELFGHAKGAFTGAVADRPGRFEQAHGGTLFLDEIGELTPQNQVRLLRVLETRTVERVGSGTPIECDVRLVTATHRDLEAMVARGEFREDLFFRIQVFSVTVPPLRDRPGDIEILARHFVRHHAARMGRRIDGLGPGVLERLLSCAWPGNVRQLRNVIEHGVIMETEGELRLESLPPLPGKRGESAAGPGAGASAGIGGDAGPGAPGSGTTSAYHPGATYLELMTRHEKKLFEQALAHFQGDTAKMAEALDLPLRTLQRRMKGLDLASRDFRG